MGGVCVKKIWACIKGDFEPPPSSLSHLLASFKQAVHMPAFLQTYFIKQEGNNPIFLILLRIVCLYVCVSRSALLYAFQWPPNKRDNFLST